MKNVKNKRKQHGNYSLKIVILLEGILVWFLNNLWKKSFS